LGRSAYVNDDHLSDHTFCFIKAIVAEVVILGIAVVAVVEVITIKAAPVKSKRVAV
jgi:hypothetical protein